mmetsp:Transcript_27004/g.49121  ORF Transcript_27004/g.49121 Transcript_27004/m.49121 type:complete len:344 (-) Transcript_27004:35-1066(-)
MVIVSAQNNWEIELSTGLVIVWHIGVLQGKNHVTIVGFRHEHVLVALERVPWIVNGGPSKGPRWLKVRVERRIVGEHRDQSNLSLVCAIGRRDRNDVKGQLGVHGLVGLHVAVEPLAGKLSDMSTDGAMVNVRLVVSPGHVINGRLCQGLHHAIASIHTAEQVGRQKVPRQHGNDGSKYTTSLQIFFRLLQQGAQRGKLLQRIHIRDLHNRETRFSRGHRRRMPPCLLAILLLLLLILIIIIRVQGLHIGHSRLSSSTPPSILFASSIAVHGFSIFTVFFIVFLHSWHLHFHFQLHLHLHLHLQPPLSSPTKQFGRTGRTGRTRGRAHRERCIYGHSLLIQHT